jgi:hypothetical protein
MIKNPKGESDHPSSADPPSLLEYSLMADGNVFSNTQWYTAKERPNFIEFYFIRNIFATGPKTQES